MSWSAQAVSPPPDGGYPNNNTAEGTLALFSLTTGSANTAVGFAALALNLFGTDNTALGTGALLNNTASANTGIGSLALFNNMQESEIPPPDLQRSSATQQHSTILAATIPPSVLEGSP